LGVIAVSRILAVLLALVVLLSPFSQFKAGAALDANKGSNGYHHFHVHDRHWHFHYQAQDNEGEKEHHHHKLINGLPDKVWRVYRQITTYDLSPILSLVINWEMRDFVDQVSVCFRTISCPFVFSTTLPCIRTVVLLV